MNDRENLLRTVRFETPDWIPMNFHINPASWQHYPQDALQELISKLLRQSCASWERRFHPALSKENEPYSRLEVLPK